MQSWDETKVSCMQGKHSIHWALSVQKLCYYYIYLFLFGGGDRATAGDIWPTTAQYLDLVFVQVI